MTAELIIALVLLGAVWVWMTRRAARARARVANVRRKLPKGKG